MSTVRQVLIPVSDIGAAVDFYTRHFGFPAKFRDGDRHVALGGGTVTIARTAHGESLAGNAITCSVMTEDVSAFVTDARAWGARVVSDLAQGPHELRAVVADNDGNPIVVYSRTVQTPQLRSHHAPPRTARGRV